MPDYPNRSDLRNKAGKIAASAAKGQTYGEAGQQMAAQRSVPMGASPVEQPPTIQPGQLGAFGRPSERPGEPVTSGAPFGPGRNAPPGLAVPRNFDPVLAELRALYQAYPSEELADMLDSYAREGF